VPKIAPERRGEGFSPLRAGLPTASIGPLVSDSSEGHPKGLYVLFGAEMFERLCYYGMRALLTLYLTKSLMKGDVEAFGIYGAYTALGAPSSSCSRGWP
jgi:hypothetical protein